MSALVLIVLCVQVTGLALLALVFVNALQATIANRRSHTRTAQQLAELTYQLQQLALWVGVPNNTDTPAWRPELWPRNAVAPTQQPKLTDDSARRPDVGLSG